MLLKLNKLYINLPIILLFFPAFVIYINPLHKGFLIYNILLCFIIATFLIFNFEQFSKKIIQVYKITPFKYYIWTIVAIVINILLLSVLTFSIPIHFLYEFILFVLLSVFPLILYLLFIIDKHISIYDFIKFFMLILWINLISGLVSWLGMYFDISFINNIFDFFSNMRILCDAGSKYSLGTLNSNYAAFGLPRLDNLCEEPAQYASFLCIYFPFVYSFSLTKLKIFNNKQLNYIIKISFIPLCWLNLLLTFSPIMLLFSIIITAIYFRERLINLLKKRFIFLIIILLLLLYIFCSIDFSETFISRIINVLTKVHTFDDFILVEPSLATRVINYINEFIIFFKHPLTGVGLGNMPYSMLEQLSNSPVSLTKEINFKLQAAVLTNTKLGYNKAFIYHFLAENGIVVFSIFIFFYYKLYKTLSTYLKINSKQTFNYIFLKACIVSLSSIFLLMFYSLNLYSEHLCIMIAVSIMLIYHLKKNNYFHTKLEAFDENTVC